MISKVLDKYSLQTDFEIIKRIPFPVWKQNVTTAIEKEHRKRLREDCFKKQDGSNVPKTKTVTIIPEIDEHSYIRKPKTELLQCTKYECKAIIMARYGMLECGINYKGTLSNECTICKTIDDEEHRLNSCIRLREINFYDNDDKIKFDTIYSTDIQQLRQILSRVSQVWNVKTGHGSMNN